MDRVTDWDERIAQAERRGSFMDLWLVTDDKHSAAQWGSCPVGQLVPLSLRPYIALPTLAKPDPELLALRQLGEEFNAAVQADQPAEAKRLLAKIRKASAALPQDAAESTRGPATGRAR
jgi:hypothetical protein